MSAESASRIASAPAGSNRRDSPPRRVAPRLADAAPPVLPCPTVFRSLEERA